MEKISFSDKFEHENRACRLTALFPKRCKCGDCAHDVDTCDVVFLDNGEFKRGINFDSLKKTPANIDNTDPNVLHDSGVQQTSEVQGQTKAD